MLMSRAHVPLLSPSSREGVSHGGYSKEWNVISLRKGESSIVFTVGLDEADSGPRGALLYIELMGRASINTRSFTPAVDIHVWV